MGRRIDLNKIGGVLPRGLGLSQLIEDIRAMNSTASAFQRGSQKREYYMGQSDLSEDRKPYNS